MAIGIAGFLERCDRLGSESLSSRPDYDATRHGAVASALEDVCTDLAAAVGQLGIRRQIEPDPAHPVLLLNSAGQGYRVAASDAPG